MLVLYLTHQGFIRLRNKVLCYFEWQMGQAFNEAEVKELAIHENSQIFNLASKWIAFTKKLCKTYTVSGSRKRLTNKKVIKSRTVMNHSL